MNRMVLMSSLAVAFQAFAMPALAQFEYSEQYSWEDGGTVLGMFTDGNDNLIVENSAEQANSGLTSLKMTEDPEAGTPQAYVAYIENLADGDEITVSFWVYDTTPGTNPSGRIWAHYADSGDVNSYRGSAGGNSTYSDGNGWDQLENVWVFDAGDPPRDALVIEARIYSAAAGDFIYVDDIDISVKSSRDDVRISVPAPSDCLDLSVDNLVAGDRAMFTVAGGTPGARGVTVYGLKAGETKVNDVAGYCATFGIQGVRQKSVIGGLNRSFDGDGNIQFELPIPGNAAGLTVYFQSAERGTCPDECVSNLVEAVVQ